MIKSVNEFDSVVHAILVSIRDNGDYYSAKDNYSPQSFADALEYATKSELILGLTAFRNEAGGLQVDSTPDIRLSRDGLMFIENFAK